MGSLYKQVLFVNETIHDSFIEDISNNKKSNVEVIRVNKDSKYIDISNSIPKLVDRIGFMYHNNTQGILPFLRDDISLNELRNNSSNNISFNEDYFSNNIKNLIKQINNNNNDNDNDNNDNLTVTVKVKVDIITCKNLVNIDILRQYEADLKIKIYHTTGLIGYSNGYSYNVNDINNIKFVSLNPNQSNEFGIVTTPDISYNIIHDLSNNKELDIDIISTYFDNNKANPFEANLNSSGNQLLLLGPGEITVDCTSNTQGTLTQDLIDLYLNDIINFGITVNDSNVLIGEDILLPNNIRVVVDNSDNFIFNLEGNNKTIKIYDNNLTNEYPGFIYLEDNAGINVNNLILDSSGTINLSIYAGGLIQANLSSNRKIHRTVNIKNCENKGLLLKNDETSGLTSVSTGNLGVFYMENCINNLPIEGYFSNGLIGQQAGREGASVKIINCENNGDISGIGCSGICGAFTGIRNNELLISNCINNGNIMNNICGGIANYRIGQQCNNFQVLECYNTGNITGPNSSGIINQLGGFGGSIIINKCYNTGSLSNLYTSGIAGSNLGAYGNSVIIKNCYNTGSINNDFCTGIVNDYIGYGINITDNQNKIIIENCFNIGNINGNYNSGIVGTFAFSTADNELYPDSFNIKNCFNLADLSGNNNSGIAGFNLGIDENNNIKKTINIQGCYNISNINNNTGEIISHYQQPIVFDSSTNLTINIDSCYCNSTGVTYDSSHCSIVGNYNDEDISFINFNITNTYSTDSNITENENITRGANSDVSELDNGNIGTLDTNYFEADTYDPSYNFPLLKVFRDNIVWNPEIYVNYDIVPIYGTIFIPPTIPANYIDKVLRMQTTNRSNLSMQNLMFRRVNYEDLKKKINRNNDNSEEARILRLKYRRVYNSIGK
jgi:hypothetical protein